MCAEEIFERVKKIIIIKVGHWKVVCLLKKKIIIKKQTIKQTNL